MAIVKCLDGPAMGRQFLVRRCPVFLRVVEQGTLIPGEGEFDVLDLTSDEVSRGEVVHVYLRVEGTHSAAMLDGPKLRGHFEFADYRHVSTMPEEEAELRDNDRWRAWCVAKAEELGIPCLHSGVRSPGEATTTEEALMEDPKTEGTEGELREEDVTRGDNLDDKVSEGDDLPPAQAGGTAEGEDAPAEPDGDAE